MGPYAVITFVSLLHRRMYPREPQRAFALLRSPWHHFQKKACGRQSASEPTWLARADTGFCEQGWLDNTRLVFIDETAVTTNMVRLNGWNPRRERLLADAPMGHWETVTFIAGLRQTRIVAPMLIKGAMNGEAFLAYVEQTCLASMLKRGDIVVADKCAFPEGLLVLSKRSGLLAQISALLAAIFSGP